jgi:Poly(3-hydroxybutyrate) depolymerase
MASAIQSYATSKTETIEVDGLERSYLVYTPSGFNKSQSHSVLMVLHGLNGTSEGYAELCNAQAISDMHNALVVFPQAVEEQSSEIKSALTTMKKFGILPAEMDIKYPWGAGARISAETMTEMAGTMSSLLPALMPTVMEKGYGELNETVDDVKFINLIYENLQTSYNANDSFFVAGASMGGAMAYKYAYAESSKAMKICILNGFVGAGVDTVGKAINIPALIFHSKADAVVKYEGGMFNGPILPTVNTVAAQNGCGAAEKKAVANVKDDGNTVEEYDFACDEAKKVVYFESDNAAHTDFLNAQTNDVDFFVEMSKFFYNKNVTGCEDYLAELHFSVYPNPVENELYSSEDGSCVVKDLTGRTILSGEVKDGKVNLSSLSSGIYLFTLENEEGAGTVRIVKK